MECQALFQCLPIEPSEAFTLFMGKIQATVSGSKPVVSSERRFTWSAWDWQKRNLAV